MTDLPDRLHSALNAALAGRYDIVRELGRGGMAVVYLALDVKHERPVAIKVLRPELASTLGVERFLQEYRQASGETLPFTDGSFDVVYCCDVLEHVTDLARVIAESARVLKAGGVYLYDTINRTPQSKLIVIKLFQEWGWTSFMPPRLHDWQVFIRPSELVRLLERQGLRPGRVRGLKPRANPLAILRALRARKQGPLRYWEAAERIDLGESADTSVLYLGYAQKATLEVGLTPRRVGHGRVDP